MVVPFATFDSTYERSVERIADNKEIHMGLWITLVTESGIRAYEANPRAILMLC